MILAGDIGGTKSLLGLFELRTRSPVHVANHASAEFPDLESLITRFLENARSALGAPVAPTSACLGIAGPVRDGAVRVTNLPWHVDAGELGRRFSLSRVEIINDFVAAAWGIDSLAPEDLTTLQAGQSENGAPRVIVGAGTGFGVAYSIMGLRGYQPVAGEGGHAGFAPSNPRQMELWRFLHARYPRVTLEHILSGRGLAALHAFCSGDANLLEASEVVRRGLEGNDPAASAALDLFIECYGSVAGDFALHVMGRGGVYVAGGIAAHILQRMAGGGFIAAFNDKAPFSEHLRNMPVHVVTSGKIGLLGAAAAASA
jgi:glucokinase